MRTTWARTWPAQQVWGRFVTLHEPTFCLDGAQAAQEGLTGSFAMFRLADRTVVVDLAGVEGLGLGDLRLEILAHEVGHHVLCPADLSDHARLLARVRRALPGLEEHAAMVANLYADLLINDRLQRGRGLHMDRIYRAMRGPTSPLWVFYLRIYEILWALPSAGLTGGAVTGQMEGDAQLGARLAQVYARDWLAGAAGFAALCRRYLEESTAGLGAVNARVCRGSAGADAHVPGLTALDPAENEPVLHPALDPRLNDFAGDGERPPDPAEEDGPPAGGQFRQPFQYGQLLRELGIDVSDHQAAVRYYRERALPHLIRFPTRAVRRVTDPIPEGVGTWDLGQPLEQVDWLSSVVRSPIVIPGITTVQRVYGGADGNEISRAPVDLDLYVDSSGSMPDPRVGVSHLALAGTILALSALRAGARVQVTLWSGPGQFAMTDGFVRDEAAVLGTLTGCIGGSTAFPLHVLRDTYTGERARPAHIVVISDDGVDTMFTGTDEAGRPGAQIAARALRAAGAGSLVLRLSSRTCWSPMAGTP